MTGDQSNQDGYNKNSILDRLTRRRLLQSTAGLSVLAGLPQTVRGAGNEDGLENKKGEYTTQSALFELSNSHLRLPMTHDGLFGLWTENDTPLLYPSNTTSFLTVRVDGTSYVNSGGGMEDYLTTQPQQLSPTESQTEWRLPEVTVKRNISLDGEAARISLSVKNEGERPHEVDIRYLLDYQVDDQDGAPIFYDGDVYTHEQTFESPSVGSYSTYDQIPDPEIVGERVIDTATDRIDLVHWPSAVGTKYEYSTDSTQQFYTPGSTSSPDSDSASLTYWELGELDPDEETTVTTYYGVGKPEQAAIDDFERALDEFEQSVKRLLSTTIQGRARAHAEIYSEIGDEYASNLINYFGYEGDVSGVSEEDVNQEVLSKLETLTEGVSQPNAENLYYFFDEMFGAASPEDSVDNIESTFAEYLRGSAEGQTKNLLVNGRTIAEIESRFVNDFKRRRSNAIDALRAENPPEDIVRTLTELVSEKVSRIQTRENEFDQNLTEVIETIRDGEEVRVIGGTVKNDGSSSDVRSQLAISGPVIGLGIMGGGKLITGISATHVLAAGISALGIAGISGLYSGSIATSSLGWMQYSSMYWTTMTTWANTGPSARHIVQDMIADKALEEIGLSPEEIIEDYTGVEIELITGLDDIPITLIEYAAEGVAEEAENIGRELVITNLDAPGISGGDIVDGVATEIATVTVENRSSEPTTPTLINNQTEIRSNNIGPIGFPVPEVGSSVAPTSDIPTIPPGEQRSFDLRYTLPVENGGPRFVGLYELKVTIASSPYHLPPGKDSAVDGFRFAELELPDVDTKQLVRDRLHAGNSMTETTTISTETDRAIFDMSYGGSDLDLHLYDQQGNHVGRNYDTGEFEEEIPQAFPSGPDGIGESFESIRIDDPTGTYNVEVVGLETDPSGTRFSAQSNEISNLDPILDLTPGSVQIGSTSGETIERVVTVEEVADGGSLTDITISTNGLTPPGRDSEIPSENISTDRSHFDVASGDSEVLTLQIDIPGDIEAGDYTGDITISSNESSKELGVIVSLSTSISPYTDEGGVVDSRGLNAAVRDYLDPSVDLSDEMFNDLITSYLTGTPVNM